MLPAYKITYENGSEVRTSMAEGITREDAEKYFLGKRFDMGSGETENMQTAIKVEEIEP